MAKYRTWITTLLLVFSFVFPCSSIGQGQAPPIVLSEVLLPRGPTDMVKSMITQLQQTLRDASLTSEIRKQAIHQIAMEHVDFAEMSGRVVGKRWNTTDEKRAEFVGLFAELLELAYLKRMDGLKDATVTHKRETIEGSTAEVKIRINAPKFGDIDLDFLLHKAPQGWMVYDVIFEGIGLVANYRAQFISLLEKTTLENVSQSIRARINVLKSKK